MSQGMRSLVFTAFHPNQDWHGFSQNASFRYAHQPPTIVIVAGTTSYLPCAVEVIIAGTNNFCSATVVNVAGGTGQLGC